MYISYLPKKYYALFFWSVSPFFSALFFSIDFPKKVNKAIVTTQDPYTIQTLMYLQFSYLQKYGAKLLSQVTKGWPYEQGILQSPEVLLLARVAKTLAAWRRHFRAGQRKSAQRWESVSRVAAKKRTPDSKKLRLSYSAADRQQLNSHFCVWVSFYTCAGV